MKAIDYILLAAVAAVLLTALVYLFRDRRHGCCGGGCSGGKCSECGKCGKCR